MENIQDVGNEHHIIINDLLSFMVCKSQDIPKEKLLHCVKFFYSDEAVQDARKILLSAMPVKKSIRFGKRKKNNDPLLDIYECLQLTSAEDLPIIVCKDLNNVPSVNDYSAYDFIDSDNEEPQITINTLSDSENDEAYFEKDISASEDEVDSNFQAPLSLSLVNDIKIYKREQLQMRHQISEMVAIISELKEGLKNFTEKYGQLSESPKSKKFKQEPFSTVANGLDIFTSQPYLLTIESDDSAADKELLLPKTEVNVGFDSPEDCFAQLQKFIDEDDDENIGKIAEDKDVSGNVSGNETDTDEYDLSINIFDNEEEPKQQFYKSSKIKKEIVSDYDNDGYELNLNIFGREDETQNHFISSNVKKKSRKRVTNIFKHPLVVVPSHADKKVILIEEERGSSPIPAVISNCSFSLEAENSLDISTGSDAVKQIYCFNGITEESSMPSNIMTTEAHDFYTKNQIRMEYLQCTICEGKFNTASELRKHKLKEHMPKYSFDCTLCSKNFSSSAEFHTHFVSCLNETKLTQNLDDRICAVCGTFFALPKTLLKHISYHSEARKLSCPQCSFRFSKAETLDAHIKNKHNPLNTYFCQFCPQSFISKNFLLCHTWNHTGEKPFKCEVCDFKSSTTAGIQGHLQAHGCKRKMICKICDFTCLGFSKLTRHMQYAHTTPLVCPRADCGKSYIHYFQYKRHRDTHLQEAKFKCSLCLYSTSLKSSEIKHIKTHSNPNFQCPECFVNLASKHNVARHLKSYCRKNFPLMDH